MNSFTQVFLDWGVGQPLHGRHRWRLHPANAADTAASTVKSVKPVSFAVLHRKIPDLPRKLAPVFLQYMSERPEMISPWRAGASAKAAKRENKKVKHMNKLLIPLTLVCFALCATAWSDNNRVIHLISTCTAINNFVDIGPPGPSTGDLYVWVDEVFTPDGSQKLGEAFGRCNLIDPTAGSFGCTIVGVFTNGSTITEEGILYNVPGTVSVFAITGGTGDYRGATGESTAELGSPCGPHHVTITLHGLPSP